VARKRCVWLVGKVLLTAGVMVLFVMAGVPFPAVAGCPSQDRVKEELERLTQNKVEVVSLRESVLSGICEVAFRLKSKLHVAYVDADGRHFIFGKIVEADTALDLTNESLMAINRLTSQEMTELPALTAFSIGSDSAQVLYYVTDPQCPYCKTGEDDLKKMAAKGTVHVRFLLLPLKFHKGAKEQCISVICDKKGLEDFEKGYQSENQCEQGRRIVESTVGLLTQKGINGTPTYIFSDGRIHMGLLKPTDLERRLIPEGQGDRPQQNRSAGSKPPARPTNK